MQTPAERHRDVSGALSRWIVLDLAQLAADYETSIIIIHTSVDTYALSDERMAVDITELSIGHKRVTIRHQKNREPYSHHMASTSFKLSQGQTYKNYVSPEISICEQKSHPNRSLLTAIFRLPDGQHDYIFIPRDPTMIELLFRHLDELSGSDSVHEEIDV